MLGVVVHALTVLTQRISATNGDLVPEQRLSIMVLGAVVLSLGASLWRGLVSSTLYKSFLVCLSAPRCLLSIMISCIVHIYFRSDP